MADITGEMRLWAENAYFDADTRGETAALGDDEDARDRFAGLLEFGTAGLRGVMAAGTNRMNRYTVRMATAALCMYLREKYPDTFTRGLVIAYDSRHNSADFARETALTACACGVPAYLFGELEPTPVLSFAVRELGCAAGVVITASHNTKEYNGYKAYDETGCQLLPAETEKIQAKMRALDLLSVHPADEEAARGAGLLRAVPESVCDDFLRACSAVSHRVCDESKHEIRIVYTPLHGAGNIPVRRLLSALGYENVAVVPQQEKPDGDFPTVPAPNPEKSEALAMGIRLAMSEDAHIVVATDPDSDRIAAAVLHKSLYQMLTGNQLGALLVNYLIERTPSDRVSQGVLVTTIVTGTLGSAIARAHGMRVVEVPTGFKYIGREITRLETDPEHYFFMGYEESCGFLAGTHVRDKDAVSTALLVCEMAAYYNKVRRMTLIDVLGDICRQYGCYLTRLDTIDLPAEDMQRRVSRIMSRLRERCGMLTDDVSEVLDYKHGVRGIPVTDMLKLVFEDGSWMAIRPSGTEPKIKVYHEAKDENRARAEKTIDRHRAALRDCIGDLV